MGRKLYVGNLPYSADEAELQSLFSQAGAVDTVHVVTDRATGRARGFAFIEMMTNDEAAAAITQFDQTEMGGRRLTVSEARATTPAASSPAASRGGKAPAPVQDDGQPPVRIDCESFAQHRRAQLLIPIQLRPTSSRP